MSTVLGPVAITNYHRLGSLNSRHLFLTAMETEKSTIQVPAHLASGESPFPDLQMAVPAASLVARRE